MPHQEGSRPGPPPADPFELKAEPTTGRLSGRAKALIIVGSLLCAAVFFGALLGAFLSSEDRSTGGTTEFSADAPDPEPSRVAEGYQERCDPAIVGEQDGPIVSVYEINDAELGSLCFGMANAAAVSAWERLVAVAPASLLDPVVSLSGFDFAGEPDIVAFAIQLDDVGEQFAMAVEVDEAERDPQELQLTMVHELAHVFTQTRDQFAFDAAEGDCDGFFNYYGCFPKNSYIDRWVAAFWSDEAIASLPEDGDIDEDGGDERCLIDPSFPGAYAASHPEEDFAESFAAYVFSVDLPDGVDPRIEFFSQFPELAAFRTNAAAMGLTNLPNNYDECG